VLVNRGDELPEAKPFPGPPPVAEKRLPGSIRAGEPVRFACTSRAASGAIVEWLWDFGDGIPEVSAEARHTYSPPGTY
jgi:hypothetical protein